MASQPIPLEPKYLIDLIVKRRWIILIPFCIAMGLGIYFAITLPKIYEAETLILIQPQKVPQNYVQPIVSMDTSARLSTLSQQVLSRTNIEKLLREFRLFDEDKDKNVYMEDKLKGLRERISINVSRDRRGNDAFSIAFKGAEPEKVMKVANALATYFIDENLKIREAQAVGTSDFLDNELESMKKQLETNEKKLTEYKRKYLGGLPEQLETNVSILTSLREQKTETQAIIRGMEKDIYTLKNTDTSFSTDFQMDDMFVDLDEDFGDEGSAELAKLKQALEMLQLRYKDKHPDVVRLKRLIRELEEKQEEEADVAEDMETPEALLVEDPMPAIDFNAVQLAELSATLKEHKNELKLIDERIALYEKRIDDTPKREQELLSIQRDYDNMKGSYESLLSRKLESDIAVNMERRQKGEQFRILDSARLPEKPISPNMKQLFAMFIGGGLAIGCGIVFLLEFFNTSFKRPEDIEEDLQLPVLCYVPRILSRKKHFLKNLEHVCCAAFGLFSLLLMAGFALLTLKGVEPTLELVRTISRL